eukprot:gnl/TRDRNA2_/TRDRNA2_134124_c0_seq2.p1 gnl/TRDRNA2_/TRDRNA2_134124_c0~~gnl/TRDRNA2_/TRDRNA2_134124_c0_seq2.p1  ORF type:complete len:153 (+),score=17.49 gnl/TRDRNA2_/TRDRNA2_134124_c0_seq2:259-717(+)
MHCAGSKQRSEKCSKNCMRKFCRLLCRSRQQAVELQLALEVLQALKHFMHKPYEVIRCNDLSEFCLSKHVFMDKADASGQERPSTPLTPQASASNRTSPIDTHGDAAKDLEQGSPSVCKLEQESFEQGMEENFVAPTQIAGRRDATLITIFL